MNVSIDILWYIGHVHDETGSVVAEAFKVADFEDLTGRTTLDNVCAAIGDASVLSGSCSTRSSAGGAAFCAELGSCTTLAPHVTTSWDWSATFWTEAW